MPSVKLPLPPSVNHCYVTTRQGRRVLTKDAKAWLEVAGILSRSAARGTQPLTTWTRVTFSVTWPDRRIRDVSNLHKLGCDVLTGIAYDDDHRALVHDDVPRYDKTDPHLTLTWRAERCEDATAATA